jgi:hypothetical protein
MQAVLPRLFQLLGKANLPAPLQKAMAAVQEQLPGVDTLFHGAGIQSALFNSGTTLEHKLLQAPLLSKPASGHAKADPGKSQGLPMPRDFARDIKANLLRALQQLTTFMPANPPSSAKTGLANLPSPSSDSVSRQAEEAGQGQGLPEQAKAEAMNRLAQLLKTASGTQTMPNSTPLAPSRTDVAPGSPLDLQRPDGRLPSSAAGRVGEDGGAKNPPAASESLPAHSKGDAGAAMARSPRPETAVG